MVGHAAGSTEEAPAPGKSWPHACDPAPRSAHPLRSAACPSRLSAWQPAASACARAAAPMSQPWAKRHRRPHGWPATHPLTPPTWDLHGRERLHAHILTCMLHQGHIFSCQLMLVAAESGMWQSDMQQGRGRQSSKCWENSRDYNSTMQKSSQKMNNSRSFGPDIKIIKNCWQRPPIFLITSSS